MTERQRFTIIRNSGRSDFSDTTTYFDILSSVALEYMSAGSNWDRPNMLLLNGEVVIDSGLSEIAWEFGKRKSMIYKNASEQLQSEFKEPWI